MAKINVGEIGLRFLINTDLQLIDIVGVAVGYKKPSGAEGEWPGSVNVDNNKEIQYITADGDLDEEGRYKAYSKVIFSDVLSLLPVWQARVRFLPLSSRTGRVLFIS